MHPGNGPFFQEPLSGHTLSTQHHHEQAIPDSGGSLFTCNLCRLPGRTTFRTGELRHGHAGRAAHVRCALAHADKPCGSARTSCYRQRKEGQPSDASAQALRHRQRKAAVNQPRHGPSPCLRATPDNSTSQIRRTLRSQAARSRAGPFQAQKPTLKKGKEIQKPLWSAYFCNSPARKARVSFF